MIPASLASKINMIYVRRISPGLPNSITDDFKMQISIGDIRTPVTALIDSGATTSAISFDFYNRHRRDGLLPNLKPLRTTYEAATAQKIDSKGYIETRINLGNVELKKTRLAVLDISTDLLVGADVMRRLATDHGGFSFKVNDNGQLLLEIGDGLPQQSTIELDDRREKEPMKLNIPVREIKKSREPSQEFSLFLCHNLRLEPGKSTKLTLVPCKENQPKIGNYYFLDIDSSLGNIGDGTFISNCVKLNPRGLVTCKFQNTSSSTLVIKKGDQFGKLMDVMTKNRSKLLKSDIETMESFEKDVKSSVPGKVDLGCDDVNEIVYEYEEVNVRNPGSLIMERELDEFSSDEEEEKVEEIGKQFTISHTSEIDNKTRSFPVTHNFKDPEILAEFEKLCVDNSRLFNNAQFHIRVLS